MVGGLTGLVEAGFTGWDWGSVRVSGCPSPEADPSFPETWSALSIQLLCVLPHHTQSNDYSPVSSVQCTLGKGLFSWRGLLVGWLKAGERYWVVAVEGEDVDGFEKGLGLVGLGTSGRDLQL